MHQATTDAMPIWSRYSPGQRWLFLAALCMVSMWNYADRVIMSVLLEPIKKEFGATDAQMGLLTGVAFAISYASFSIPLARISDRGDRRLVVSVSIAVWSFFTACCGLAGSFQQLALARVGVGVGESGSMPPSQSLIADYFPPAQRTRAFAIFTVTALLGNLIAFTVGAHLAVAYGWRVAFIGLGLPGLLIALFAWVVLREPRREIAALKKAEPQEPFLTNLRALAGKRSYVLINFAMIMYYCVAYGASSWFPAYLDRVMKVSLAEVGAVYGPASAIATIMGALIGGFVTDWLAARDRRWLGWAPGAALLICLPLFELGLHSESANLFIALACTGMLFLTAALPGMLSLMHMVCGSARRAMAVAMLYFFASLIGLSLGPLITGMLSDYFSLTHGAVGLRISLMTASLFLAPCGLALVAAGFLAHRDAEP
jgi:MFS family permease